MKSVTLSLRSFCEKVESEPQRHCYELLLDILRHYGLTDRLVFLSTFDGKKTTIVVDKLEGYKASDDLLKLERRIGLEMVVSLDDGREVAKAYLAGYPRRPKERLYDKGVFLCPYCDFSSQDLRALKGHFEVHCANYCPMCDKMVLSMFRHCRGKRDLNHLIMRFLTSKSNRLEKVILELVGRDVH